MSSLARRSFVVSALFTCAAFSQALSGPALVNALRQGGHVIVMRHTASPRQAPSKDAANADNVNAERQLDQTGRDTATAMGKAFRDLKIPVGEVLASPTYRAMETAKYAQFPAAKATPEIGDNGRDMQGGTEAQATWLKQRVTQLPKGTNAILITHMPNVSGAFPAFATGLADGEALIFGAGGMLARVKIEEWPAMKP